MPIYDYRCQDCGQTFELLVSSSTVPACPACASARLDKLMSAPTAPGRSAAIVAGARAQAAREGHFSNFSAAERPRR
jgi:putative FmdB family regulatory protein